MAKWMKYISVLMVIVVVASFNLSSTCKPKVMNNNQLIDLALNHPSVPSVSESFELAANANESDALLSELTWTMLADCEFKDVYIEELEAFYWKPTFGKSVLEKEGQEVYITGYMIPVDYDEDFYVLSRFPFANCFFCGGAGPESVIDLRFAAKTRKYETDERLTFRGKLALNANDVYQMNYILEGAREYKP